MCMFVVCLYVHMFPTFVAASGKLLPFHYLILSGADALCFSSLSVTTMFELCRERLEADQNLWLQRQAQVLIWAWRRFSEEP